MRLATYLQCAPLFSALCILCACGAPPPAPQPPPTPIPEKEKPTAPPQNGTKEAAPSPIAESDKTSTPKAGGESTEGSPEANTSESDLGDPLGDSSDEISPEEKAALEESYQLLREAQGKVRAREVEEGMKLLERVAARTPSLPEPHYNLGVIYEQVGSVSQARQAYQAALRAKSDFTPAWLGLVKLSIRARTASSLLNEVERSLASSPKNLALLNAQAKLFLALSRRPSEVINVARKILREDEQNTEAMLALATAFAREGKHELCVSILENAKSLAPDNAEIYFVLFHSLVALGDKLPARFLLEEAVKRPGGSNAEVHNLLGLIYLRGGDFVGAEAQFKTALERWPSMIEAQVNLGNALKGQQRYKDASDTFEQALSIRPNHEPALFNLAILYLDGNFEPMSKLDQLKRSLEYMKLFQKSSQNVQDLKQIATFQKECERLIDVQTKLQAQLRESQKQEAELKAKEAAAAQSAAEISGEPEPLDAPTPEPSGEPEPLDAPTPEPSGEPEPLDAPTPEPSGEPEPLDAPTPEPSGEPEPLDAPTPEPSGEPEPLDAPTPEPLDAPQPLDAPASESETQVDGVIDDVKAKPDSTPSEPATPAVTPEPSGVEELEPLEEIESL